MFDEIDRLRQDDALHRLLCHYTEAGAADRDGWQDRLMELPAVERPHLVKLHGELLAFGWIEMNVGMAALAGRAAWPNATERRLRDFGR
jgi:hypothetical protein